MSQAAHYLALPECFVVGFIGEQELLKLCQDFVRDSDRLQDLTETFGHHFFAKIWQITFAAITCIDSYASESGQRELSEVRNSCDDLTRRKSSKIVNQDRHQSFQCLWN